MLDTAIAIVFRDRGQELLLIKRDDIPIWVLPGGGIDAGESPEEAVCRELFEETGLRGAIVRKIAFYQSPNALSKDVHVFELAVESGEINCSDESPEVGFFKLERLPHPFFLLHRDWLADALARNEKPIVKNLKTSYWQALIYGLRNPMLMAYFFWSKVKGILKPK